MASTTKPISNPIPLSNTCLISLPNGPTKISYPNLSSRPIKISCSFSTSLPIKRKAHFSKLVPRVSEEETATGAEAEEEGEAVFSCGGEVGDAAESGGEAEVEEYWEPPEEAKIFVGKMSYDVDNERLAGLFEQVGVVEIAEDSQDVEYVNDVQDLEEDSDVLIECKDVCKSFGEKHILRGVSFKIRDGEAVGIIGPSGTGKSTILKIMAGLLVPDKGEVIIRGTRRKGLISDDEISCLRIGLVFQSAALFDSLTVRENVGFLLYEHSTMPMDQIAALVTETLAAVGLKGVEERLPSELSGGMKKRVALARSIIFDTTKHAIEPEVLLYDEPTAGLDPIASTVVEDLIRSVHNKGKDALGKLGKISSYVVVTHQHSTITRAVDRLLFLYEGKVVWQGMTHEFMSSTNTIVQQFASGSLDGPIKY